MNRLMHSKYYYTYLLQNWASMVNNQQYTISHVMVDGAAGLTSAMLELPLARRLMCWAHVIRKCREHRKLVKNKNKWISVEQDILDLQLIFDDTIFRIATRLMIEKWSLDSELNEFKSYFESQWLLSLPFFYEGATMFTPSTNNGLESLNGKIKQQYTMRHRLPLSAFLQTAERMLKDWSFDNEKTPFAYHITYKEDLEKEAFAWSQKVDKSQITPIDYGMCVVPAKEPKMNVQQWIVMFNQMNWTTYDDLKDWLRSARLLNCTRLLPPWFCTCKYEMKEYACVHAIGLMMFWGIRAIPQQIGKRKGRSRPKKVKLALSKD
ncbi:unnamed protein product [Didymodactylos carnosus]|uniref:SWIM-type domain-containing protein n=1 Tax=Didymodactylos carnosus TaxID=1234261 RepID=A0A815W320_9BILA|nr:unnamed protein product [Didymodactylos carnosus]CAF4403783.1 unnamed protein product [Didymodactylos carnosus]